MSTRTTWVPWHVPWDDGFPYHVLARFGITPASTGREVLDVSLEMTPEELSDPEIVRAWESLRTVRGRLLVDFFCPELPPDPAAMPSGQSGPLPLPMAFLRRLATALPPELIESPPTASMVVELPATLEALDRTETATQEPT